MALQMLMARAGQLPHACAFDFVNGDALRDVPIEATAKLMTTPFSPLRSAPNEPSRLMRIEQICRRQNSGFYVRVSTYADMHIDRDRFLVRPSLASATLWQSRYS
jgi:hypothetical protein